MQRLRDPINGCSWDIEQNFETIAPYTLEEAFEVVDAIERRNLLDLKDELGDLLLQVVYHAQMASELNEFDFDDVAQASANKMIRRHPHVFDNPSVASVKDQNDAWEEQKRNERKLSGDKESGGVLGGIAKSLPALLRAYKLQKRASRVNFDWATVEGALCKLKEEIMELEVEINLNNNTENRDALVEEVSDVIFSAANVARKLNIDPEAALRVGNKKFETRFRYLEEMLLKDGKEIEQISLEEMEIYWQKAKAKS